MMQFIHEIDRVGRLETGFQQIHVFKISEISVIKALWRYLYMQLHGSCPTPCCEVCDRGLPHKCIRNDHQPWMGNPATKTHTGKTGHDVQDYPQPYWYPSPTASPPSRSQHKRSLNALPYCRINVYRCSFFPSGIRLWNQLPESSSQRQLWRPSREGWPVIFSQQRNVFYHFHTSPHNSGGVLWFHVGRLWVHLSVRSSYVCSPFFVSGW